SCEHFSQTQRFDLRDHIGQFRSVSRVGIRLLCLRNRACLRGLSISFILLILVPSFALWISWCHYFYLNLFRISKFVLRIYLRVASTLSTSPRKSLKAIGLVWLPSKPLASIVCLFVVMA